MLLAKPVTMTTDDVRCPYCVDGDEFRLLRFTGGRYVCGKCGHIAAPEEQEFVCTCRKCRELNP
jgi:DNA-directed RNA polymerase subunit RPC12/RpoP